MSREKPKKSSKIPKNAAPLHYNIYNIAKNFSPKWCQIGACWGDFLVFPQYLVVNITTVHKRGKLFKKIQKNCKKPLQFKGYCGIISRHDVQICVDVIGGYP